MPKSAIRLLSAALVFLVVIGLLPFTIQYFAIREVREIGLGDLTIANTDFNLFTLKLVIDDYELIHGGVPQLKGKQLGVDLSWSDIVVGRIGVEQISSDGAEFWLRESEDGAWSILPAMVDESTEDAEPGSLLQYSLDALFIKDASIHIEGQQIAGSFNLPTLNLNDLANFDAEASNTTTEITANWGDATITVSTTKELMAEEPPFEVVLDIVGLSLADFKQIAGLPELDGTASLRVELAGKLSRSPLIDTDEQLNLAMEADITASITNFVARDPRDVVRMSIAETTWQGKATANSNIEGNNFSLTGNLQVMKAEIAEDDLLLSAWEQLSLGQAYLDSDNRLGVESIRFDSLQVLTRETPLALLNLTIDGVGISPDGAIAVDRIQGADLTSTVVINADGDIQVIKDINRLMGKLVSDTESEPEEPTEPTPIRLGNVNIEGQLNFQDNSITPTFGQSLNIEAFNLTSLDTAAPASPSTLVFKSSLDEFSRIDIDATSTLLQLTSNLDSTIKVTQLPLDKLSVYLEKAIGYQVKTGQLDVESTVKVENQQLDVNIDALLRKFRVNPSDRSDVDNELGMPLGAALNLVRDSDDNITLNGIKLKGDLNDPAISTKQLITKAVSKALLAGTMTYFKFALQPYGAALMAVQAIGKQAGKVSLDPLMMQPRTAEIAIENADYLDRLADLMAQRPQVHLMICGEASTIADIPESPEVAVPEAVEPVDHTPMLIELADERAKLIKRMLFEKGIASERLLICKSDLTAEPAGARVILGID